MKPDSGSRTHLVVLALVTAVLVGVGLLGYFKAPRLGLDLQGGLEVILQAKAKKDQEITDEDMQNAVEIIERRVNSLGVSEPEVRRLGSDQILVALAGVNNPDEAANVIRSTAQLKLYDIHEMLDGKPYLTPYDALKRKQAGVDQDEAEALYLFGAANELIAGPETSRKTLLEKAEEKLDKDLNGELPPNGKILAVPPGQALISAIQSDLPQGEEFRADRSRASDRVYMLLDDKPSVTGEDLRNATADIQNGGWVTNFQFKDDGDEKFGDVTEELFRRGELRQQNQHFAIVLDNEIRSVPFIDYTDPGLRGGIRGGGAVIQGMANQDEARNLALVLNSGALPLELETISKTQVSATLGQESLRQGLLAGAAGLLVVMIYMILFYRFLGVIADFALLAFAFMFYGLIVGIPIVMTLPGIAGMILTIGVAADANVVIFERIREEFRAGRSIPAAVYGGYKNGLRTILDANVVTLITAGVLFIVASGGVRGFALLLGVGVILSMFTAVAATFAMLGTLSRARLFQRPSLFGVTTKASRFHFRWSLYRKHFLGVAAAVVVASVALIAWNGLELGIDFKSGSKVSAAFDQNVNETQLRDELSELDDSYAEAVLQRRSAPVGSEQIGESEFSIQVERLPDPPADADPDETGESLLRKHLDDKFGVASFSVQTIGPTFGRQIIEQAVIAVIISLLLICGYIWMRFESTYAWPVLAALAHDVVLAIAAYSLTGRELTTSTVAAILTILGYSLYDTVIIFDRMRENTHLLRKSTFAHIVDRSLNEVLTRSLNTSFIVLLPVLALFLYGGETLQDFAFALLVGIFAGAYSSLAIAAPLVSLLKEREPAWARRKKLDESDAVPGDGQVDVPDDELAGTPGNGVGSSEAVTKPEPAAAPAATAKPATASDATSSTTPPRKTRDRRPRSKRKP